jgi:hypothetical protein
VVIAGADGNYYRCFPSGVTHTLLAADNASSAFQALGLSNVFGDATQGKIVDASRAMKPTPITFTVEAVTCYLLNLNSLK